MTHTINIPVTEEMFKDLIAGKTVKSFTADHSVTVNLALNDIGYDKMMELVKAETGL